MLKAFWKEEERRDEGRHLADHLAKFLVHEFLVFQDGLVLVPHQRFFSIVEKAHLLSFALQFNVFRARLAQIGRERTLLKANILMVFLNARPLILLNIRLIHEFCPSCFRIE